MKRDPQSEGSADPDEVTKESRRVVEQLSTALKSTSAKSSSNASSAASEGGTKPKSNASSTVEVKRTGQFQFTG